MSKLTIKEKEYAIKRAEILINNASRKFVKKSITKPANNTVFAALGFNRKDFDNISTYRIVDEALDYHPAFEDYRKVRDVIVKSNSKLKTEVDKQIQDAKDFIMLGDREEVFDYIKFLGEKNETR